MAASNELEKLVLEMSFNDNKFQKKLERAVSNLDKKLVRMETGTKKTGKKIAGNLIDEQAMNSKASRLVKNLNRKFGYIGRGSKASGNAIMAGLGRPLSIVAGLLGTREIIAYADAWTRIGNQLVSTGTAMSDVAMQSKELVDLAIANRTELTSLVTLYTKTDRATESLGLSQKEVARFTDITTKSVKIQNATMSEQQSTITQLSQALESGLLAGDEYKSIRENAPLLAKAIADYMGVTVGELKKLSAESKITSDIVVKAVLASGSKIDAQFARTKATISDSMTNSKTAITEFIGVFDRMTKTSEAASGGISNFTKYVRGMTEDLSDSGTVLGWIAEKFADFNHELQNPDETRLKEVRTELKAMKIAVEGGNNAIGDFFDWFGADMMGARVDSVRRLTAELEFLENKMLKASLGFKGRIDPKEPKFTDPKTAPSPATTSSAPKPASSFSFPKTDTAGFTTTVDSSGADALKDEREFLEVMKEKAAALEQDARLYGLDADQAELMRVQEEMLSKAKQLGIENTDEFSDAYTIMSATMVDANSKMKEMQENEQLLNEVTGALEQGATEMFGAFLDGSKNDMNQAAKAMIKQLALILLKALALKFVMDSIFPGGSVIGGAVGGDLLKGLLSGGLDAGFGGFREKGGPVKAGMSYIVNEKRPEVFVPDVPGTIIPSVDEAAALAQQQGVARLSSGLKLSPALPSRSSNAGAVGGAAGGGVTITNHYDFSGADPSIIARIPAMLDERDRQLKATIFKQLPAVQARRGRRLP